MTAFGARGLRTAGAQRALCMLGLMLGVACGDASRNPHTRDAAAAEPDPDEPATDACEDAEDGAPCGADSYCQSRVCLAARCGDGVVTRDEACDDGNARAGDGCDPICRREHTQCGDGQLDPGEQCDDGNLLDQDACSTRCMLQACGNEALDFGEECDDGNRVDTDLCSNACRINRCRNGRLDPGEECDDGDAVDRDACTNDCKTVRCGNGRIEAYESCDDGNQLDGDDCPSDCVRAVCGDDQISVREVCENPEVTWSVTEAKAIFSDCIGCQRQASQPEPGSCLACAQSACRAYQGAIDVYAGCFERLDAELGAPAVDPFFLEQCTRAVGCALRHRAWLDPILSGGQAYCGSASLDVCVVQGPALDAPCVAEFQQAARSDVNTDVHARFTDFSQPSGWAYFFLDCLRTSCAAPCAPWAPP